MGSVSRPRLCRRECLIWSMPLFSRSRCMSAGPPSSRGWEWLRAVTRMLAWFWTLPGASGLFALRAPDAERRVIGDGMLEDKAKELGRIIGQSPEYQAVKKSSEALNGDREAVSVLQEMEKLRVQAQQMIQRGEQPTPELEQQLDDLLMKVQGNPVYQRAISAQENFDKVMYQVNNWIMDGMKKGATSSIITLG